MDGLMFISVFLILCVPSLTFSGKTVLNNEAEQSIYEDKLKTLIYSLDEQKPINDVQPLNMVDDNNDDDNNVDTQFDCKLSTSPEVPTSVHQLRPGDIKVMAALGDSITAANGAKARTLPGVITQYRGVAALIGGDESLDTVGTLPNIFRKYNEKIYGFSTGTGSASDSNSKLNVAVPGAKSHNMPDQATNLVNKMIADPNVDFENDWKVVSMFIGGNDLCAWCKDTEKYAPEQYVANIEQAITILQKIPRTFVNIIGILKVWQVSQISGPVCDPVHKAICSCGMGNEEETAEMRAATAQYQDLLEESITSGKFDTREDFTAVYQPFFHDTDVPTLPDGSIDYSFWAPDCFHFSQKGQAAGSVAIWNNLIQPVGEKDRAWDYSELTCPAMGSPYLYTNVNSNPQGLGAHNVNILAGQDDIQQSDTGPTMMVGMAIAGCVLVVIVVATVSIAIKRRRHSTHDEKRLLMEDQIS